ncbi:MAG: imidazole glycerol phosphate synthase subunit HisH [Myxococcota bacterium]
MPRPPRIAVLDLGTGNLRSVAKALERVGLAPEVGADPDALRAAAAVVLPGVGNFAAAAANLRAKGLDEALREVRGEGRPYLGICLGLQLLFEKSDEQGGSPGLGWLPGRVTRFSPTDAAGRRLAVPHIGWNEVRFESRHPMLAKGPERAHYYFVHAYRAEPQDASCIAGRCDYGEPFPAAVASEQVFAVQFHPEKSQHAGLQLLEAFAGWVAACS